MHWLSATYPISTTINLIGCEFQYQSSTKVEYLNIKLLGITVNCLIDFKLHVAAFHAVNTTLQL